MPTSKKPRALCFLTSTSSTALLRPLLRQSLSRIPTLSPSPYSLPTSNGRLSLCMSSASASEQAKSSALESDRNAPVISPERRPVKKGDSIDVTITRIGYGGVSVGRIVDAPFMEEADFELPVYAPKGSCPGDFIRCSVTRVRRRGSRLHNLPIKPPPDAPPLHHLSAPPPPQRSYIEANFTSMLQASTLTQPVPCKHFGSYHLGGGGCGGCSSMHLSYRLQLDEKDAQMAILYAPFTSRENPRPSILHPIIGCKDTLHYRNKMEFSFGRKFHLTAPARSPITSPETDTPSVPTAAQPKRNSAPAQLDFALGLHAPQRFDKVIEINECHLHQPVCDDILHEIRELTDSMLLEPYDSRKNVGYFRNVAIRVSTNAAEQREIMVNLITSPCDVPDRLLPMAQRLADKFPDVKCVLQNMRGTASGGHHQVDEKRERLLFGERAYIEQLLCGLTFRISANSFFQTNEQQAATLFQQVRHAAKLQPSDTVLDLFCGTGTIGLSLARDAHHVYGIDIVQSAIEDAKINASDNGIENATFIQTNLDKVKDAKRKNLFDMPEADIIVVDPPRAGLHPDMIKYLAAANVKRIVYVSCNPVTQIRDIADLLQSTPGTFTVTNIQPVDMFPNSHHIECVATIERL